MRKFNDESRPLSLLGMHSDLTGVEADDFLRQRHTDSVSLNRLFLFSPIK